MVLAAKNHNPTVLNPDFLRFNEIVPKEWELETPPLCLEPVAQVAYQNGVTIIAQPQRVSFSQSITNEGKDLRIPAIATKYAAVLPHVNYTAVGINPTGHIDFGEDAEETRRFVMNKFLQQAEWLNFGKGPARASIKLTLPLDKWLFNISVEEGLVQMPGRKSSRVVVFAGNFHADVRGESANERVKVLQQYLSDWKPLLETMTKFVKLIEQ